MIHWEWKTVTYIALGYFSLFAICSVAMMSEIAVFNFYWTKNTVNFEKFDRVCVCGRGGGTMFVEKIIHDDTEISPLNYDHNKVM